MPEPQTGTDTTTVMATVMVTAMVTPGMVVMMRPVRETSMPEVSVYGYGFGNARGMKYKLFLYRQGWMGWKRMRGTELIGVTDFRGFLRMLGLALLCNGRSYFFVGLGKDLFERVEVFELAQVEATARVVGEGLRRGLMAH